MVFVFALFASLANALTSVLQRMGVEDAPKDATLRLSLLTHALRRGIWILGFSMMIVSFATQAVALHFGRLSQVQPILTTELLFLVLILSTWFRFRVGLREWAGALMAAGGLTGFLWFAQPTGGELTPKNWEWIVVGGACAVGMVVATVLALQGPRWWRAAMFGTAAAIGFAFTAALTKVVTTYTSHDWIAVLRHWETYGLVVAGLTSVFLAQNAFHAGPIAASQSTLVLVDPLASILIGIGLFGDNLQTSGYHGPLEALSLLVLFAGAFSLSQSPLVSGMKGDENEHHEMLSLRSGSKRLAESVAPPAVTRP
ncbi:MAG TPA: DMT family transporter [Acidimicrobiales bacterium]|nr:DMT family transporter [Acidimicrobiales bacterium]